MTDPTFVLVCEDCGHVETDPKTRRKFLADYKENRLGTHLSTAEFLKRLHAFKVGHKPYIRTEMEDDVHAPGSAHRVGVPLE